MLTFDVPRFSASWLRFRRIAPKLLAAVAATLVIGSLLVHTGTRPAAAAPPGGIPGAYGYRYWTISVSNLAEVTAACEAAGYRVAVPVTELRPGITISIIEDPDGNWVELLQI